jgi:hypothetical protein
LLHEAAIVEQQRWRIPPLPGLLRRLLLLGQLVVRALLRQLLMRLLLQQLLLGLLLAELLL